MVEDRG